mgnify:FL=1
MSILTAKMLEPHTRRDGSISLTAVYDGSIEEVDGTQLYGSKASKEEIALYEDLTAHRWPLPGEIRCRPEELKTLSSIETNIIRYLRRYIWLRNPKEYTAIADWVISTYFRDQFYYAPLLIFDGLTTSGKSTAIYAISQICYRGELFDSASGPAIAREIEDYGTTILLDEILDSLAGDRGTDLFTMMKSAFGKEGTWVRADPKGRKNYRYRTYTHIALSIKGDTLPEDLYNRSIRINMTAAPPHITLADVFNWHEDDRGRDESPDTIRTDLYRLKAHSAAWPADSTDLPIAKKTISFQAWRREATRDVTQKCENGQWLYAYVNGLPDDSPIIRARDRNIANTIYAVGLATGSGTDVISVIVDNAISQRETTLDTPEALTFVAMLELIDEQWTTYKGISPKITPELFRQFAARISTSDIAERHNAILADIGNAARDPVPTRTVTAKLNAMGFAYGRSGGHGGNRSWLKPDDTYFQGLFVRYLRMFCPERVADFVPILVNKTEKS